MQTDLCAHHAFVVIAYRAAFQLHMDAMHDRNINVVCFCNLECKFFSCACYGLNGLIANRFYVSVRNVTKRKLDVSVFVYDFRINIFKYSFTVRIRGLFCNTFISGSVKGTKVYLHTFEHDCFVIRVNNSNFNLCRRGCIFIINTERSEHGRICQCCRLLTLSFDNLIRRRHFFQRNDIIALCEVLEHRLFTVGSSADLIVFCVVTVAYRM